MTVRTRFAPSPTGALHLGNARIAVLNWLFARHSDGRFVLRIEDTDVERNVPGAEEEITGSLRRLGLDWDEGPDVGGPFGPYRQSERSARYRAAADRLLDRGLAFDCYCTPDELAERREARREGGAEGRRDVRCRGLEDRDRAELREEGRAPSIRFAVSDGEVVVKDLVRGAVTFDAAEIEDFVILKSNGAPTYNFAVVVDDSAMEITHVIRGAGHLSNTPRQRLLYDALELEPPIFVHVPHVLDPEGRPLSKRHGAPTLREYLDEGYHPDAIINYLSLLSWSSPGGEEILPPPRLIEEIDLTRLGTSDVMLDPEKLRWLSGAYIRRMTPTELIETLKRFVDPDVLPTAGADRERVGAALQKRIDRFSEARELLTQFHPPRPMRWTEEAAAALRSEETARVLEATRSVLAGLEDWDGEVAMSAVRAAGAEIGLRGRALFMPVRAALTGATAGPELADVLAVQGRETALRVLDEALALAREREAE